jgi:hypothetical protein
MLASLPLLLAAAPAPVATLDPINLFRSVCLSDRVSLPRHAFADIAYSKLPKGARVALNWGAPGFLDLAPSRSPVAELPASEVPNRILAQLPKKRGVFLLLPAADKKGALAPACSAVWKGSSFAAARDALVEDFQAPPLSSLPVPGKLLYYRTSVAGADVAAAEFQGWTVLRVAPDTSPDQESGRPK